MTETITLVDRLDTELNANSVEKVNQKTVILKYTSHKIEIKKHRSSGEYVLTVFRNYQDKGSKSFSSFDKVVQWLQTKFN